MFKLVTSLTQNPQVCRLFCTSTSNGGNYDIAIVGGGIIGIASARELKQRHPNLRIILLEKESKIGTHQTKNNSGVIHAGMYYVPGSLKAKLCVEGMHLMYKYIEDKQLPYKKVGKLIVATDQVELDRLMAIHERGIKNKTPDLQLIDGPRIKEIEPFCSGLKALWSPHTGIVDFQRVAQALVEDLQNLGGTVQLLFEVNSFEKSTEPDYPVGIISTEGQRVNAKYVLTCAGLYSDKLAVMSGCGKEPCIVPFRGEYLLLKKEKRHMVKGNIYPVPDPTLPFLGVHFTPKLNGDIWLGPNAVLAFKREGYSWSDVKLSELAETLMFLGMKKAAFKLIPLGLSQLLRSVYLPLVIKDVQRYVKDIKLADIERGPAGVRAQAMDKNGQMIDDFVFEMGKGDFGKFILHTRNAPSPGATGSLAIAKMITDRFENEFELPKK